MDIARNTDNYETPNECITRVRDIALGSENIKTLHENYETLVRYDGLSLIGRVFHGNGNGRFANVSYANINATHQPRKLINLGSSDYAGLNTHPRVIKAAIEALQRYGNGSTGGRLLNGTTDLHLLLEHKLSEFLGTESVVTFNSGYCANLSAFSCFCAKDDMVITDILNHQSIMDGLKLGGANYITYLHNCIRSGARSVESILRRLPLKKRKFIVTDGIFSMDGDVARLDEIVDMAEKYNAFVIVDEAHAVGAYGPNGRGTVAHFGLGKKIDIITGVLSKALPGIGGFVAGPKRSMDILRYSSNGYIFSTALPPSTVAGVIEAIDILTEDSSIQTRLQKNSQQLRDGIQAAGLDILGSESAVIPITMPDPETTLTFARKLHEEGVFVNVAGYPAVSALRPRLRLNVNANLDPEDIDYALAAIDRCARATGLANRLF